ncbi:MAG TPA: hypothetical protein VHT91_04920 [Kofleriaceae bacterium]|jgi:hypothetical protein|nr:hypothetical protein [Kofleriaceae bacterium]
MRALASLAAAAGAACTGPPCQIDRLDDRPDAAPGEVRHGFTLGQNAGLSATATGIACLTCSGIYYFDPALTEQRHVAIDLRGDGQLAVAGDTTFVLDDDIGDLPDASRGGTPGSYSLFALSATGQELWRHDGSVLHNIDLPDLLAGPDSVAIDDDTSATVFDPTTGAARWTASSGGDVFVDALALDATDGLIIASGSSELGPATPAATLHHVAPGGATTWTVTWTTTDTPPAGGGQVAFVGAAATAGGGAVVAGRFSTATLELGELSLTALPLHGSVDGTRFVAAVDAGGAVRWAVAAGKSDADGRLDIRGIAALGDGAVICGNYAGAGQLGLAATDATTDAFIARIDPDGTITAHAITGDGDQSCQALAIAGDGSATITVLSDTVRGGSALRVGGQIFDGGPEKPYYVLNLVP